MPEIPLLPQVVILAVTLTSLVILLGIVLLPDAESDTWPVRLYQGFMFKRTRLARIMARQGVDVPAYIRARSIEELKAQRHICGNCSYAYFCDRQCRKEQLRYGDLIFCPNRNLLQLVLH